MFQYALRVSAPPGHEYAFYGVSTDLVGNTERKRPDPIYVSVTGVSVQDDVPLSFGLSPNYPNPFNPLTTIRYELDRTEVARLEVFDILGRRIALLADGAHTAGRHQVVWDAKGTASGVYFYRLSQGRRSEVRSMVLLR